MARGLRRRDILGGSAALALSTSLSSSLAAPAMALPVASSSLRLMHLRHTSVLVEIPGARLTPRRVLFDPSLQPSFSMQGLFSAPPTPRREESLGPLDLVCVSSSDPTSFDPRSLAALDTRRAAVLVPDDSVARRVRHLGLTKVRVLRPGDVAETAGLVVRASPGRGVVGEAIGFHVMDRDEARAGVPGRGLWHTGLLPPLEVDAASSTFATLHPADVVLACTWGLRLRAGGPPLLADALDATTLARLAGARLLVPLGQEARPAGVFSLVWESSSLSSSSLSSSSSSGPALRPLGPGAWHRVRPA